MAAVVGRRIWCCKGSITNRTFKRLVQLSFTTKSRTVSTRTLVTRPNQVATLGRYGTPSRSLIWGRNSRAVNFPGLAELDWNTAMLSSFSFVYNKPARYHKLINMDASLKKEEKDTLLYIIDNIFFLEEDPNKEDPSDTSKDADALYHLGCRLQSYQSTAGEEAITLAMPVFNKSALLGNKDAMYTYAQLLLRRNPKEAIPLMEELSTSGHGMACYDLACAYCKGYGVRQSYEQGIYWYEMAAENGVTQAYDSIGKMYLHGEGCKKNLPKAVKYFHLGAAAGDVNAYMSLGYCYDQGVGVDVDHGKAFKFNTKAADAGHPGGIHNIGVSYFAGKGVPAVDLVKAAEYYKKAALMGFGLSQVNLANMYYNGYGVKVDKEKAKEMYRNCAHPRAAELLKECEHYEEEERKQKDDVSQDDVVSTQTDESSWWSRLKKKLGS